MLNINVLAAAAASAKAIAESAEATSDEQSPGRERTVSGDSYVKVATSTSDEASTASPSSDVPPRDSTSSSLPTDAREGVGAAAPAAPAPSPSPSAVPTLGRAPPRSTGVSMSASQAIRVLEDDLERELRQVCATAKHAHLPGWLGAGIDAICDQHRLLFVSTRNMFKDVVDDDGFLAKDLVKDCCELLRDSCKKHMEFLTAAAAAAAVATEVAASAAERPSEGVINVRVVTVKDEAGKVEEEGAHKSVVVEAGDNVESIIRNLYSLSEDIMKLYEDDESFDVLDDILYKVFNATRRLTTLQRRRGDIESVVGLQKAIQAYKDASDEVYRSGLTAKSTFKPLVFDPVRLVVREIKRMRDSMSVASGPETVESVDRTSARSGNVIRRLLDRRESD